MTTLLIVILHDPANISELLDAWKEIGVPGITILQSVGAHQITTNAKRSSFQNIISMLDQVKSQQRTLFSVIEDEILLERAIAEADRLVQGFDSPQSGILFTIPINKVLGLKKWGTNSIEKTQQKSQQTGKDRAMENLLQWYKDEIETRYGHKILRDWSHQRNTPVHKIVANSKNDPIIVKVDERLTDISKKFITHPEVRIACVINNENRLVGFIEFQTLSEILMIPIIPEEYLNNASGFEKAVQYASIDNLPLAAEIMTEPVFVMPNDNLQTAYHNMRMNHLTELPVVDNNYLIKGYITLQGILDFCFPDTRT